MPYIAQYLLKLSISLAVVYLFYAVVLRRLTFHTWNRWYLLGYSFIAFFIPFIDINPLLERGAWNENMVVQLIPVMGDYKPGHTASTIPNAWILLAGVIVIGMLVMLIRLLVQYISLRRIKMRSELISDEQVRIYQVNKMIIPFSFGRSIFINQHLHNEQELKEIIRHEFIHVKQRHTADILWSELLCLLNWYNPFAWLIRKAIRQNLEFIADHHVLQAGLDRKQYQYLLLKVVGVPAFAIASQFNFSSLKKRIAMMNRMRSAKVHLIKFLFVLPLVTVLLLAFRTAAIKDDLADMTTVAYGTPKEVPSGDRTRAYVIADTVQLPLHKADTAPKVRLVGIRVDSTRYFIGVAGNKAADSTPVLRHSLPGDVLIFVDGEEQFGDDVLHRIDPAEILSVSVLKDKASIELYGERARNGVILVTTKKGQRQPGKGVPPAPSKLITQSNGLPAGPVKANIIVNGIATQNGIYGFEGLIVVDGKVYDSMSIRKLDLDADRIKAIEVMKGAGAEAVYGPRAAKGVIFIVMKQQDDRITYNNGGDDGQWATSERMGSLVEEAIKKNILFVGIDNQLPVKIKGVPANEIEVTLDQGLVSMQGELATLKPLKPGLAQLRISRRKTSNSPPQVLEERVYTVKYLPPPSAIDAFRAANL